MEEFKYASDCEEWDMEEFKYASDCEFLLKSK